MQETELLVDFYGYDISVDARNVVIRSRDNSLEKSIRLAYIKQYASWCIWKGETYSHEDLIDFMNQDGLFIKIMQNSMDKYYNTLKLNDKKIRVESYCLNMAKLLLICDEKLQLLEKDEERWNKFIEEYNMAASN